MQLARISPTALSVRCRQRRDTQWSVSVTDVGGVIGEVPPSAEVMRIVLEVPPAAVDELLVAIQPEAIADFGELVQAVQHLRALSGCRTVVAPQHAARKLMNRIREPPAVAIVADPIIRLTDGRHNLIVAVLPSGTRWKY